MAGEFENLIMRDTRANQPAAGIAGRLYYVTDESIMERDNGSSWQSVAETGGAGSDTTAIHDNTSGEMNAVTEKASPVSGDILLIEDSEASYAKKRVQIGNLPGGAGGAPTDAKYLTTASNGTLSAEVVIPGLAGSPDIAAAGGAGTSEEYDTTTTGLTWDNAPTTVDSHTTAKSHLYVKITGDTNRHHGSKAFAPAGAYDVRMKLSLGGTLTNTQSAGFLVNDNAGANSNGVLLWLTITPASVNYTLRAYTYASSAPTQRGGIWTLGSNVVYLRHVRDGSNNCSFYFSMDGLAWQLISTVSFTFTPSLIGFKGGISDSGDALEAFVDWLRTSV